jgi:hypothetical protein
MAKKPVLLACFLSILITGLVLVVTWGILTGFRFSDMNPPSYFLASPEGLYFVEKVKSVIVISGPMIPYQNCRMENAPRQETSFSFYTSDGRRLTGSLMHDAAEIPALDGYGYVQIPRQTTFAVFAYLIATPAWINKSQGKPELPS